MSAPRRSVRTKSKPDASKITKAERKNTVKHKQADLNSAKQTKLRKKSLKNIEKNLVPVKLVKKEPDIVLVEDEPETITIKDEPETTTIIDEPETATFKDEPEFVLIKDLPGTAIIKGEPETGVIKVEPETLVIKDEPETAIIEDDTETDIIKDEPETASKSRKKVDHVVLKVNNVEMISIPDYPDIKIKMVKGGKHPYMCHKCDLGFWTKKAVQAHASVHMLRKPKQPSEKLRCDICMKQFKKLSDLQRHSRVHTGEKPSVCKICNKGFGHAYNLSKHLLTHLHIKPFVCEICNKQFGRNDVLRRHMLTHSVQKPIKCSVCDKGFIRQSQLLHHMRMKHPGQSVEGLEETSEDEDSIKNEDSISNVEAKTSKVKS